MRCVGASPSVYVVAAGAAVCIVTTSGLVVSRGKSRTPKRPGNVEIVDALNNARDNIGRYGGGNATDRALLNLQRRVRCHRAGTHEAVQCLGICRGSVCPGWCDGLTDDGRGCAVVKGLKDGVAGFQAGKPLTLCLQVSEHLVFFGGHFTAGRAAKKVFHFWPGKSAALCEFQLSFITTPFLGALRRLVFRSYAGPAG